MYQIGQRVVYGVHGVCCVTDLEERVVDRNRVTYLVLEPIGQGSARFLVPTHNPAAMAKLRKMMTAEQLEAMLRSEAVRRDTWLRDDNARKNLYRELLSSGDRERLMQTVYSIYRQKARNTQTGKRLHLCDDNFLRDAEKLLAGEVSVAMNMDTETAIKYIRKMLKEDA